MTCIACTLEDDECTCMEPGDPCVICGVPLYIPITPWKANDHDDYIEDDHEWGPEDDRRD